MVLRVLALAALVAVFGFAAAPKRQLVGKGGFNPHAHEEGQDHGLETISLQIDVTEGSPMGWLVLAGDVHNDSGDGDHHRAAGPLYRFPGTYMKMERFDKVTFKASQITIVGTGKANEVPAKITVVINDGKGKKGEDEVQVEAKAYNGETLLFTHGHMLVGDFKVVNGGGK